MSQLFDSLYADAMRRDAKLLSRIGEIPPGVCDPAILRSLVEFLDRTHAEFVSNLHDIARRNRMRIRPTTILTGLGLMQLALIGGLPGSQLITENDDI